MASVASNLPRLIEVECGNGPTRLFRNNTGMGWQGERVRVPGAPPGSITLVGVRPLHAGLCVGSSDLIGWRMVEITQAMVGTQVAIFAAIEAKTGSGRPTKQQSAFIAQLQRMGGIGGIARSVQDAQRILSLG